MAVLLSRRWFHFNLPSGDPAPGTVAWGPNVLLMEPYADHITLERTRLSALAWGQQADGDGWPSIVNNHRLFMAYAVPNFAETGSYPPPPGWPGIPPADGLDSYQPTVIADLTPRWSIQVEATPPFTGPVGVRWCASLPTAEGDSAGRRAFHGTYAATLWVAVSPYEPVGGAPGYDQPYRAAAFVSALVSSWRD